MIQFGNKVNDWKGPETCFSIYGPDDPYKKQEGHFCKYCTEKFIDWIRWKLGDEIAATFKTNWAHGDPKRAEILQAAEKKGLFSRLKG